MIYALIGSAFVLAVTVGVLSAKVRYLEKRIERIEINHLKGPEQ